MTSDMPDTTNITRLAEDILAQRYIPRATYRLQFNSTFPLRDALALVPYLHDLGISDIYASPLLRARPGSSHGYDICDHSQINPEVGGEEALDALAAALRDHSMGLIFDMVPNHMGIDSPCNLWWMDVLENGPSSIYANHFDIDWHPIKPELANKVLLPILGDQYGNILESGQLHLSYEDGAFWLHYYEHLFPIAPGTYSGLLSYQRDELTEHLGSDNEYVQELESILTAISYLPPRDETNPDMIVERNREKEIIKRRIASLYQASPEVQTAIDAALVAYNGTPDDPRSFDLLDRLIDEQAYRLAFWRVAMEEINYRRFFDINDLAAIRVEAPHVFHNTHDLLFRLLARGCGTGLRIDHPDGLWNPPSYFRQLQASFVTHRIEALLNEPTDPEMLDYEVKAWFATQLREHGVSPASLPLYVVAEKILSEGERLPEDWAVHGTSGYDFLNLLNGIFVDGANAPAFDRIYNSVLDQPMDFHGLVNVTKKMIMLVSLSSQINKIVYRLERISEKNRKYRDFTLNSLTFVLREVMAGLPVYRTYLAGAHTANPQDQEHVATAIRAARQSNPRTAGAIFEFIHDTLLLRNIDTFREEDRNDLVDFVMEMQQLTGPVMAKGLEDTAFYVYNRLVTLNEVGGHPEHFGISVADFHQGNIDRARHFPHSMLCTSTHDTKRSEDVRARISILSEMPDEWEGALGRWREHNAAHKTRVNGVPAPSANDEYLFYQTLLGAWHEELPGTPEFSQFRERLVAYMEKATREAKIHTSWVNPNAEYDTATRNFVQNVLSETGEAPFIKDREVASMQRHIAYYGRYNSLAQVLLKLTAPGVPDTYQGTELWDFSLVDPDNRRPVEYQQRIWLLSNIKRRIHADEGNLLPLAQELHEQSADGRIKLYLIYRTLNVRREYDQLFAEGDYTPLEATGAQQAHVCAFARSRSAEAEEGGQTQQVALVVAPRLVRRLVGGADQQPPLGAAVWGETWLDLPQAQVGTRYHNAFTSEVLTVGEQQGKTGLALADIFAHFPVALLIQE